MSVDLQKMQSDLEVIKKVVLNEDNLILKSPGYTIDQICDRENISRDTFKRTLEEHDIKPIGWSTGGKCKRYNLAYIKSKIDGNWNK